MSFVKKTVTLPKKLVDDVNRLIVGTYYASLSDAIREGLRSLLKEHEREGRMAVAADLYRKGRITARQAAEIMGVSLREALGVLARRGVYLRYGADELAEDMTSGGS
ncbi:TPA: hypothetical protein EYP44_00385 [Candidatus Bathyarchaeota archaeon]|nr:hypothetical protein [Candidatus Bathyarchaeota archaeon]